MKFLGIIPARFASTRFPGKPLVMLGGKTVIERVYKQVIKVIKDVYVATDDDKIYDAVIGFGGKAIMTSPNHRSGTDRIQEAVEKIGGDYDVIINIQGDEPFIHPSQIETVCECFKDNATQIATLGKPFTSSQDFKDLENPNSPKLITDNNGFALYFSRSIIPFIRNYPKEEWIGKFPFLKHIGLYAYRKDVLAEVTKMEPSSLEIAESLEQLRWLQNGYKIKVGTTDIETIGIDTPEDLKKAEEFLNKTENN